MDKSKKRTKRINTIMDAIKADRRIEREKHFAEGRPLVATTGGWFVTKTVTVNRKKRRNKRFARGRVRVP